MYWGLRGLFCLVFFVYSVDGTFDGVMTWFTILDVLLVLSWQI